MFLIGDTLMNEAISRFVGPFLGAASATLAHHGFIPQPVKEGEDRRGGIRDRCKSLAMDV